MAEAMQSNLDRPVIFNRINFETSFHELSFNVGNALEHFPEIIFGLLVIADAVVVLIKLNVIGKHRHYGVELVRIEGIEQLAVHATDSFEQLTRLGRDG